MYVLNIYFRHIGLWLLWQKQLSEAHTNKFQATEYCSFWSIKQTLVTYVNNINYTTKAKYTTKKELLLI